MNKIVKSIASVTLAFGTMLGVSTTVLPIEDTAHALQSHIMYITGM